MSNVLKALARGGAAETDPNFKQTVLLLHGDGTNGAQNNTFLDSSTNNFTITRNGNTTQGTFSPFSVGAGEWGNYFDGTANSSLRADATTDTNLSGDFTLQAWIFPTANGQSSQSEIMSRGAATTLNGWHLYYLFNHNSSGANRIGFGVNYAGILGQSSTNLPLNQWSHIALTRSGNNFTFYLNGVADGTFTSSSTPTVSGTEYVYVGRASYDTTNRQFPGYISNASIIKGTVLTTFNTTTPLSTSATNQSLLTCTLNRFVDANTATTAKTLTVGSAVRVTPFSPFAPTAAYSAGTNGGSGYFNGSGYYLTAPANNAFNLGTNNFTIEGWFYFTSVASGQQILSNYAGSTTRNWAFYTASAGVLSYYLSSNGSSFDIANGVSMGNIVVGQWTHIALVRNGSTFTPYINGVAGTTTTSSASIFSSGQSFYVSYPSFEAFAYVSGVRVLNGTAINYASTGVPTAPLTAITNTSLLLNFTNAGIIDNTGKNVLETVGNAQIDTAVKKYGTGSLEFDGTGDYLLIPDSNEFHFGSENFTIEAWINTPDVTPSKAEWIVSQWLSDTQNSWGVRIETTGELRFWYSTAGNTASNIAATTPGISNNTWTHIAVVRNGSTVTIYVDGVSKGSGSVSGVTLHNSTASVVVGGQANTGLGQTFTGFIDDLRITKGVARYTANFTAPTKEFPDL